jgi:hypothetical protein
VITRRLLDDAELRANEGHGGDELRQHDLIQFVVPSTGQPTPWIPRTPEGEDVDFSFKRCQCVQEDVLAGAGWAIAWRGLFQIYHFVAREAAKGRTACRDVAEPRRPNKVIPRVVLAEPAPLGAGACLRAVPGRRRGVLHSGGRSPIRICSARHRAQLPCSTGSAPGFNRRVPGSCPTSTAAGRYGKTCITARSHPSSPSRDSGRTAQSNGRYPAIH